MTSRDVLEGAPDQSLLVLAEQPHNNAYDSIFTRGLAMVFEKIAAPLIEHVYGPIAETSHTLGVVAVNGTLTLPRLPMERKFGRMYEDALEEGDKVKAFVAIGGKVLTKALDGMDGPVARGTGTTTLVGAGLDPLVDMAGVLDDALIIKRQAQKQGDLLTVGLMNARLLTDAGVLATGGIAHPIAEKYAESKSVVFEEREKAKANAMGKLKFGLSLAGDTSLLASYVIPETKAGKHLKRTGQLLTGASIGAGAASIYKYTKSTIGKIHRARQQSKLATELAA